MASEQEMLDRIAKLSTAIEQQKSMRGGGRGGASYIPSRGGGRGGSYPAMRGRGGGHNSLINNNSSTTTRPYYNPSSVNNTYVRPSVTPPVSHNRQLVLNGPSPAATTAATYRRPAYRPPAPATSFGPPSVVYRLPVPATSMYRPPVPTASMYRSPVPPVKKSQHRKLIINHKGNATTNNTMIKSIDATTGRKQVAIDGVDFVVKGRKLIRKDIFDSNTIKSSLLTVNTPKVLVRRTLKSAKRRDKNQNMVLGKAPPPLLKPKKLQRQRTKGGNMVFKREPEGYIRQGRSGKSLVLNTQKAKLKKPRYCGFFTRYGKCPNGSRCPFQHDPSRRAICPRFLQNRCKKGLACKLSHLANPNNMPHCVHFQKGLCKNDPCSYIHVRVSHDAPVCKAFAMEGYCVKGITCDEKHVHVCPEFAETGKCSNANCRLPHVARRTASDKNKATGIVKLGSWVSPQYFHAQMMAKLEKRRAIEEATAAKVWTRPVEEEGQLTKQEIREKEENDGFVRLFDDSDEDDGWSQYERESDAGEDIKSLRFREEEEEEEGDSDDEEEQQESSEEEEGEEGQSDDQDEEMEQDDDEDGSDTEEVVYEEISDTDNMSEDEVVESVA